MGPEEPRPAAFEEFPPMCAAFQNLARDFAQAVRDGGHPRARCRRSAIP